MTDGWTIARLKVAAPQLAAAVRSLDPAMSDVVPLNADVLELAATRLPRNAIERPFASHLLQRLRLPATATSVAALMAGYAATHASPSVWRAGATSKVSDIASDGYISGLVTGPANSVWTIDLAGNVAKWGADGTRSLLWCVGWTETPGIEALTDGRIANIHEDTVRIWSPVLNGLRADQDCKHDGRVEHVVALANGGFISNGHGALHAWDADGSSVAKVSVPGLEVRPAVWKNLVAVAGRMGSVELYEAPQLTPVKTIERVIANVGADAVKHLAFTADGRLMVATRSGLLRLLEQTGQEVASVEAHKTCGIVSMFPSGQDHVVTMDAFNAKVWNATLECVATIPSGDQSFGFGSAMTDGHLITYSGGTNGVRIWSPA